jgi:hypothetical protein
MTASTGIGVMIHTAGLNYRLLDNHSLLLICDVACADRSGVY